MGLKKLFGGDKAHTREYDIDDLIVLERYSEAEARLKDKLKITPGDLHSHVKLAEVYTATGQVVWAVEEYIYAGEEYADDGFYEKAIALIAKAQKLAPSNASLAERVDRYEMLKRLEHSRTLAIEGLMQRRSESGDAPAASVLDAQQLWQDLAESQLFKRLPGDQLKRLLAAMLLIRPDAGEVLASPYSQQQELFLVARGQLESFIETRRGTVAVRSFGTGDILGEAVLLERRPWPAGLRAAQPSTLLKLTRDGLEEALSGNADPRGLLDALREQRHDRELAAAVDRLKA